MENTYYAAPPTTVTVEPGSVSVPVDTETRRGGDPIRAGDLLLVIQMQGAEIDGGDDSTVGGTYGDGSGASDRQGALRNESFVAGLYELAIAAAAPVQGGVLLTAPLIHGYANGDGVIDQGDGTGQGQRRYQVVRVAQFIDLAIPDTGGVEALPWDGRSGGVVAIDVSGTLTLNGLIDASGSGFRGGSPTIPAGELGTEPDDSRPCVKGEGITGTPARVYSEAMGLSVGLNALYGASQGQGAPGNAGGCPREEDSGGAGGGGGGQGGVGEIGRVVGTHDTRPRGGLGYQESSRLILGGGGGSGSLDDPAVLGAVSGQAGGGIVFLRATTILGAGAIVSDGDDGQHQPQEGGGGGGGGGTVLIVTESANLSGLTLRATGGDGSSTDEPADAGGGGGGGGVVMLSHPTGTIAASPDVAGGSGGTGPDAAGAGGSLGFQQFGRPPSMSECPDDDRDDDGDGLTNRRERPQGDQDTDGDGAPDHLDPDDDGDGVPTREECPNPVQCRNTDGDRRPDYLDPDDDDDGIPTADEVSDGATHGNDVDDDGRPNWLDTDADRDGIGDAMECPDASAGCPDSVQNGVPDYLDPHTTPTDTDGDGVPDSIECDDLTRPEACRDTDGDRNPDYLDVDDDGDGVLTRFELEPRDSDGDGRPDYLDPDDDNDGNPTASEGADPNNDGDPADAIDLDGDGTPSYLDPQEDSGLAGIAGGALCSSGPASGQTAWFLVLAAVLAGRRRGVTPRR